MQSRVSSAVMQPSLDGSWIWPEPAQNPFGSFRHNGTFPESLFSDSIRSEHQLAAPVNSPSSEQSGDLDLDDSAHLYINMLDRSDIECVKSTRFWSESGYSDGTSARSSVDNLAHQDTRQSKKRALSSESSARLGCKAPRLTVGSVQAQQTHAPVQSRIEPWLQSVQASSRPVPSHQLSRPVPSHQSSSRRHYSLSSTSSSTSGCMSSIITEFESDSYRGEPSGASDSDSVDSVPLTAAARTEVSIDSDATFFMQRPLVTQGITRRKMSSGKRHAIAKKLKRFSKLLSKGGPSRLSTLAVL